MQSLSKLAFKRGHVVIGTPLADKAGLDNPTAATPHLLHQPYHRHILSLPALLQLGARAGLETVRVCDRFYADTPVPFLNSRFLWEYLARTDRCIDTLTAPPRLTKIVLSPTLLFYGLFGFFLSFKECVTVVFRKT